MARIHGRKGKLYVGNTGTAQASPVAYLNAWSAEFTTDRTDVTSFDDDNMVELAGLPSSRGDFGGWYDTATDQLYTAAVDGDDRKFYLYPSRDNVTDYWYGRANFDFSVSGGVGDAVSISGSWSATSNVGRSR